MSLFKNSTLKKSENLLEVIKSLYINVAYKYPIEDDEDIKKQKDSFTKLYNLSKRLESTIDSYTKNSISLEELKETYIQCEYAFQRIYDNNSILSAFYDITCLTSLSFLPKNPTL